MRLNDIMRYLVAIGEVPSRDMAIREFEQLIDTFGYGFAILSMGIVPNATTISLFNGATPVGSLSYGGAPDPVFAGGFAGIQSTLLFNRAQLTFNSAVAPAFAVDNIRTVQSVPEPGTLLLLGVGIGLLSRRSDVRRQQRWPHLRRN